jgi:hypothetical protein
MHVNKLLRFATTFHSLAAGEKLPPDSKDLSTVLKNLAALETYTARKDYAEKNLEHLSSGSSRIVYLTPKKTIIKMAKNDRGLAQNRAEENASKVDSKYLNKVLSRAPNDAWIEVSYLQKITEKDFKNMTDIDFKDFGEAIRFSLKKISGNIDTEKPENYSKVSGTSFFKEIEMIGKKLDLMPGDIARISSFGKKDNHPVLLDVGLTSTVFAEFYEDSSTT